MNECSCIICKKEIILLQEKVLLQEEIKKLQEKTECLLKQLSVTDAMVNKLDMKTP